MHRLPCLAPKHMRRPTLFATYLSGPQRRTSTTIVGTAYEQLCLDFLAFHLPLTLTALTRTGGKSDHGIDLRGQLRDGSGRRFYVQCKALKLPVRPDDIRAFEGVLSHQTSSPLHPLGLFFAAAGFGPGSFERAKASKQPMMLFHLPRLEEEGARGTMTRLRGMLANRGAEEVLRGRVKWRFGISREGGQVVTIEETVKASDPP